MVRSIIKRLSDTIKTFMDSMAGNIRTRQLCAVVCMLCVFVLFVCNVNSSEAKVLDESEEQTETVSQDNVTRTSLYDSVTDIKEKLSDIHIEPEETEEVEDILAEHPLYYMIDNGFEFYLDPIYQNYLWDKLKEYDNTDLFEVCIALMYHESRFEINTVSATNDHGLMQINGGNYKWLNKTLGIKSLDDPYDNIDCGVYIISYNYEKYGNIEQALIAYHQGSTGSAKSTSYSRCILEHDIKGLTELAIIVD